MSLLWIYTKISGIWLEPGTMIGFGKYKTKKGAAANLS